MTVVKINNYGSTNNSTVSTATSSTSSSHDTIKPTATSLESQPSSKSIMVLLLPLAFIGLIDAVSFMVVAPSLIFYVRDTLGGTNQQYGIILSVFSFSSFLFKPVLGYWTDSSNSGTEGGKKGGQFLAPYVTSILAASIGGLFYFFATIFAVNPNVNDGNNMLNDLDNATTDNNINNNSMIGLWFVFIGRFLGGMGAANSTLGFTYIATTIPHHFMTRATSILSTVRIIGMVCAPALNVALQDIHGTIVLPRIFSFGSTSSSSSVTIELDHLNSVGLLLFFGNIAALITFCLTFHEPSSLKTKEEGQQKLIKQDQEESDSKQQQQQQGWLFWKAAMSLEIFIPIFMIFTLNANFQLLETALAPAANHAMGWGPTQVSAVFSFNAALMFIVILSTYQLSSLGVTDISFLLVGQFISMVAYALLYFLWEAHTAAWEFVLPVVLCIACFPLLGAPARSVYTELVSANPLLQHHQGTMQALLSMAASSAGFLAPSFIASYILRSPAAVDASTDQREFSSWALLAPTLSFFALVGSIYLNHFYFGSIPTAPKTTSSTTEVDADEIGAEKVPEETLQTTNYNDSRQQQTDPLLTIVSNDTNKLSNAAGDLILPSQNDINDPKFCPRTEAYRKETTTLMGIHQISFCDHRHSVNFLPQQK